MQLQKTIRYGSTKIVTLVSHFSKLECIIKSNSLDPTRIVKVDETVLSAWNEKASAKKEGSLSEE